MDLQHEHRDRVFPGTPRMSSEHIDDSGNPVCLEFIKLLEATSLNLCQSLLLIARNPAIPDSQLLVKLVDPE